jgi:hypothetical protein
MSTFSKTMDLPAFMRNNGVGAINIAKNPATGKRLFTTDAGLSGRISEKVDKLSADLAVSWFAPEDGEASWMLHPRGEGGLETLDTFSI